MLSEKELRDYLESRFLHILKPKESLASVENYQALSAAVVCRACWDYAYAVTAKKAKKEKREKVLADLEDFFCGKRFSLFSDYNGEQIMNMIKAGKYLPKREEAEDIVAFLLPGKKQEVN